MSQIDVRLIIGGGPAGLAAARAYRELEPEGRVAIVTDEHRSPYNRPPLTKDLGEAAAGAITSSLREDGIRMSMGVPVESIGHEDGPCTVIAGPQVIRGDGFDDLAHEPRADGGFTVRCGTAGRPVGVLAHRADADHEGAAELIARGAPWTR